MLARFRSQRALLAEWFPAPYSERFRRAIRADFSRPPHAGLLWYERMGFPVDGARWRARACKALAHLEAERPAEVLGAS
jgi:hypothetical protein